MKPDAKLDEELIEAARAARERAYAPYSRYAVGAAVRGKNGRIYGGANVENASYGLSLCAERNAVMAAVLDGAEAIEACAVVTTTSPPAGPCGACRQTLAEFAHDQARIILVNTAGERSDTTLGALLPHAFRKSSLP